jgi:cytochrome c oxidase subunit 3
MTNLTRSKFQAHPFHLVSPSPWPLYTCIALLTLTTSGVLTMHGFSNANIFLISAFVSVILSMSFWWRDVISEGTYLGNHTLAVQKGLNMGVALFIVSEALFFLAIFWAFFHSALSPTVELGAQWPPMGIEAINPFELPLLNTVILLSSGVTVTYAHHSLIEGNRTGTLYGLIATVVLAVVFTGFQGVEYNVSSFTISDGAFGTCFYFGTGFHGLTRKKSGVKHKRFFTTNLDKLSPHWVTGFSDGESTFSLRITKNSSRRVGWRIIPIFAIELHKRDIKLLEKIKDFFQVGVVSIRRTRNTAVYKVQSFNDLTNVIIPHFDKYPLLTKKQADFLLFKSVIMLLKLKELY